ncbi:MAG TPA: amino acid adenylation domain-containing protein, partial [Cytophagales bacterium]|nr:amino acid adenylation domain-containing protein [Cytophagales bacterium]
MNKFVKAKKQHFSLVNAHTFKINTVFEMMVMHHTNEEAVVMGNLSVTYYELNVKANSFAHQLIEAGVKEGDTVAVKLDKSINLIVSILAIMKAGAVYLPLDPTYPHARIKYMLEDSGTRFLITNNSYLGQHKETQEINIDAHEQGMYISPTVNTDAQSLAYIIYTSGTTGNPKGVMVQHGGFVNMCLEQINTYRLGPAERVLQFASISFDASVYEIFIALLSGATLVLANKDMVIDKAKFLQFVDVQRLTFILLPPVFLNSLERPEFPTVKTIVTAGEACNIADAMYYSKTKRFYNAYGPTETSVCVSLYKVLPEVNYENYIPVGKPIENIRFYILDEDMNPVSEGAIGELWVAGVGLAKGYINKPELTQKAFLTHPFLEGERIYRTGDLVKRLPEGDIVVLGRKDQQVKIAGHRIELGAIESTMLQLEEVTNVVLNVHTADQDKSLCAYFTAKKSLSPEWLREQMLKQLPSFMVPHWFIQIKEFSLTKNGKINKDVLPSPREYYKSKSTSVEKMSFDQKRFLEVCADVLGLEQVNLEENFFSLGGHSLKATALAVRVYKVFGAELTVADIYRCEYLSEIFDIVSKSRRSVYESIMPAISKPYYATSAAQKRMFVMNSTDQVDVSYNVSIVLSFDTQMQEHLIKNAFEKLIERHEVFRTRFSLVEGEIVQEIVHDIKIDFTSVSIFSNEIESFSKAFVRPFDLSNAPLLRIGYLQLNEGGSAVVIDTHHIIADGTSMGIMVNELMKLIHGVPLEELNLQYKDYAEWENKQYQLPLYFVNHEAYWLSKFKDIPKWNMPKDFTNKKVGFAGSRRTYKIGSDISTSVETYSLHYKVSSYHLLLAGYYVLLHKYTQQEDIVVGTAVANRTKDEIQQMLGMFVNMLPLRNRVSADISF